jgi:hypothetical protein
VTAWYIPWSAEAFAFCEVSFPAVGDGLPNVGCAEASDAIAKRAVPIRYAAHRIEASCLMAKALLFEIET